MNAAGAHKQTLAVDLDEVLCEFVKGLCEFHNEAYSTSLAVQDFHSYIFREVWGGTEEESTRKILEFFTSDHFTKNLKCVAGAQEAMETLGKHFRLVVVTSRQLAIENDTRIWLDKYFPNVFDQVVFGNHWGLEGRKVSKPELCQAVGAQTLIDDNLTYALQCSSAGIRVLLFDLDGTYMWNKTPDSSPVAQALPSNVHRVASWNEVCEILVAVSGTQT